MTSPTLDNTHEEPYLKIRPGHRWSALNLKELMQYRDLLWTFAMRDLKLRYRQTALGAIWVILQPLLGAGIFSFVFGSVAKMSTGDSRIPYFVFSYAGLLGWNLFANSLSKSSSVLIGNAHLVSKVYFPRLILPLSSVLSNLVDFAVAFVVMACLLVAYHITPGWGILLLPVWLTMFMALALGAGMYAGALMVTYRDVQYVMPVFVNFLMYASPVAYPASKVPAQLRLVFGLNPLAGLLDAVRWSVLGTGQLNVPMVLCAVALSVAVFLGGVYKFKSMERRFADVI